MLDGVALLHNHNLSQDDFINKSELLPDVSRRLCDLVISMSSNYKVVRASHAWFAQQLKVSVSTIYRSFRFLKATGLLIIKTYRKSSDRYETCIYMLNDFFKVEQNIKRLVHIFGSLKRFLVKFIPKVHDKENYSDDYGSSSSSLSTLLKTKKDPVKSIYVEDNTREAYPVTWVFPKKVVERREVNPEIEMTVTMDRMKRSLGLTTNGVLKLNVFPDDAIKHVLNLSRSARDIGDVDSWLFLKCKEYCVKNNLQFKQNWPRYYDECSRRGINPASRITTQKLNKKAPVISQQTGAFPEKRIREDLIRPKRDEETERQAAAILRKLFGI